MWGGVFRVEETVQTKLWRPQTARRVQGTRGSRTGNIIGGVQGKIKMQGPCSKLRISEGTP